MRSSFLAAVLTLSACAASAPPSTTPAQVATMETLEELMAVHKSSTSGLWDKTSFSEEDWSKAEQSSPVLKAAATRVAERFGGQGEFDDGFVDYATIVANQAEALGAAAAAKDAAAASAAMSAMKEACDGCHGVYN
ncbi:MAG: hypothetical protein RIF41_14545 [Polyangiaceae bacterium]